MKMNNSCKRFMRIREFVSVYGFPRSFVDQVTHGRYAKEFTIRSGTAPNSAILIDTLEFFKLYKAGAFDNLITVEGYR
jgi:hypothetical protein